MREGIAPRIVEWLCEYQDSIELQLGHHVAMPRSKLCAHQLQAAVAPATDIRASKNSLCRPSLMAPAALTLARRRSALLKATNDCQAILMALEG